MDRILENLITGTLLGDGSVFLDRGYARYKLTAKDENYLNWVQDLFYRCGVRSNISKDKRNNTHVLYPSTLEYFGELRKIWYLREDGKTVKTVPKDLDLTPTVLLHWFLGDGSLVRQKDF